MAGTRERYSAAFNARVALEAAKQTRTLAELSRAFQVHPVQISQWKKQLLDGAESLFGEGRRREGDQSEVLQAELYRQIGRLNMEVDWLRKKLLAAADLKRPLVEPENPHLIIRRQCELPGLSRSTYYPRAGHRVGGGPAPDAADRPAVPHDPILRQQADDGVPGALGGDRQSQAGPAAHGVDGARGQRVG